MTITPAQARELATDKQLGVVNHFYRIVVTGIEGQAKLGHFSAEFQISGDPVVANRVETLIAGLGFTTRLSQVRVGGGHAQSYSTGYKLYVGW